VVSKIVNADLGGEKIPLETAQDLLSVVMFGGLDTVATMMGFVARRRAMDIRLREELRLNPDRIPTFVDEFIRLHGLTTGGRVIMRDIDYKGVPLRQGDQIMVPTVVAGLDGLRFPDPTAVNVDRPNKLKTLTFGNGPHRCPGAALAKAELRIFIEEWLWRIPEFSLYPDEPPVMASGLVSGILRMNLIWPA
jgi:cytochrome P450